MEMEGEFPTASVLSHSSSNDDQSGPGTVSCVVSPSSLTPPPIPPRARKKVVVSDTGLVSVIDSNTSSSDGGVTAQTSAAPSPTSPMTSSAPTHFEEAPGSPEGIDTEGISIILDEDREGEGEGEGGNNNYNNDNNNDLVFENENNSAAEPLAGAGIDGDGTASTAATSATAVSQDESIIESSDTLATPSKLCVSFSDADFYTPTGVASAALDDSWFDDGGEVVVEGGGGGGGLGSVSAVKEEKGLKTESRATTPKKDVFDFIPLLPPRKKLSSTPTAAAAAASSSSSFSFSSSTTSTPAGASMHGGSAIKALDSSVEYQSSDEEGEGEGEGDRSTTSFKHDRRVPRRDSFRLLDKSMSKEVLKMKHSLSKSKSFYETVYDRTVVIDNGSFCMRAGFAAEESPVGHFRNVVVRKPSENIGDLPSYSVGDEAMVASIDNIQDRCFPYCNGLVTSWDQMEAVWDHCFEDILHVDTSSCNVFLTETHLPPKASRETVLETMFELFSVAGVFLHVQPVLALYAAGLTSGCVVDSGHLSTSVFPVCQGYQLASSCIKTPHGGHHLSSLLMSMLKARDIFMDSTVYTTALGLQRGRHPLDVARYLKEKYAYVEMNFKAGPLFDVSTDKDYTLPDGTTIRLGKELARCGEAMFHPFLDHDLFDLEEERPLQTIVMDTIKSCSLELRKPLLSNIVLAGGNSHIPGLRDRLLAELKAIVPASIVPLVKVTRAPGGDEAIWRGGALLAELSTFQEQWITAEEYQENGASIVHELCPVFL